MTFKDYLCFSGPENPTYVSKTGSYSDVLVKFMHSALAAWGSQVWILGVDLYTAHQAVLWQCPTYKREEDCHRC